MRWRGHAGDIGKSGNADGCRWTQMDAGGRKQTGRAWQGEQRVAPGSAPLS
ncbi:hypothetical protein NE647_11135 [Blautia coccoides]|uniref:hypothetical protein n=1 Tax=Blautia producta TaxID=33035 RepID=UPI00210AAC5C|nr:MULTISPECIES: hypothetical protein [Blautia]MCQ4640972.1 hypothetical protein [Blautia coccoides]MCQ5123633.1 hypothetical protein [Blautia producta]